MEQDHQAPAPQSELTSSLAPSGANNRKLVIWALVGLGVVMLILIILLATTEPKKQISSVSPKEATVSVSDSSFEPQTLQIQSNTIVKWINTGTSSHQVAADPYPSNNSIAGFDSEQTLLPGDTMSYTFAKVGTYHLHDRLHPYNLQATVVVTTAKEK